MQHFSIKDIQSFESLLNVHRPIGDEEKRLLKKAQQYSWVFSLVPGIVGVAVANSVALGHASKNSDIDLVVITRSNKLWTVRLLTTILLQILGQRKNSVNHSEKFCLSFFMTENDLNLSNIAVNNDIYLAYWTETLIPIFERDNIFEIFWSVNNWYVFDEKISHLTRDKNGNISHSRQDDILPQNKKGGIIHLLGDTLETLLKKLFLPRTLRKYEALGKPYGVIVNDDMLKFHPDDRRKEISKAVFGEKKE